MHFHLFFFFKTSNTIDDRCSACILRGGLLLCSYSSTSFIHAVCSIYQVYQSSFQCRSCHFCWSFCPLSYRRISTQSFASCTHYQCTNTFHITCGLINGCTFQIDQDHSSIDARCHLHAITPMIDPSTSNMNSQLSTTEEINSKTTEHSENLTLDGQQQDDDDDDDDDDGDDNDIVEENKRIPAGTRVLINNAKEQKVGQIIGNEITYHYSVDFGDDTYSHDMYVDVCILNLK